MKDGRLKKLLYLTKIIPFYDKMYSKIYWSFRNFVDKQKRKNEMKSDRWYFKFLPIQKNKIVFDNFAGRGYGDNPKAIAEEIIRQNLDFNLVWLIKEHEKDIPNQIRQVKYGSFEAMYELATAKIWVFNIRNVKHPKKRKKQIYLQTWHGGFPLKLIEGQIEKKLSKDYVNFAKNDGEICNAFISSSNFFSEILKKYFWLNKNTEILEFGDPANDLFFSDPKKIKVKEKYNISKNTRIILYAPTFRDDLSIDAYNWDMSQIIEIFDKKFQSNCVLLLRFHPNVKVDTTLICNNKIRDVSDYDVFDELLIASDFLISDYSSVIVNAIYIYKPVFIYAKDLETYSRGFNDLYSKLPCTKSITNDELAENILRFDYEEYAQKCEKFVNMINSFNDGKASEKTVKWIKNKIKR